MLVRAGERIRLIKESAESLNKRPWHEIQLTLRAHKLETYEIDDSWSPDQLTYCAQQIEEADDPTLLALHEYLLGEDAAPSLQQTTDRPWGTNPVAVFISHRHEDAPFVSEVRDFLATRFGIDAFVAHNDIDPSKKWRDTIREALSSCHFMVAVLHETFHESQWCDQEVGWAMGRGLPVMPVRRTPHRGPRLDGFLEEHQDLVIGPAMQYGTGAWWLASQIFERVLAEPKTHAVGVRALAEAFVHSGSYDQTRRLWRLIEAVDHFDSEQLRRLEYAVQTNRQVYECIVDGLPAPDLVKRLIESVEPPLPAPIPSPFSGSTEEPPF